MRPFLNSLLRPLGQALRRFTAVLACAAPLAATPGYAQGTADYVHKDNVEGAWVQLANFPVRPMAFDTSSIGGIWVVDQPNNAVVHFANGNVNLSAPDATYPTPWNPVSVAYWAGPNASPNFTSDDELVVACRGSWCVVRIVRNTGVVKDVIRLTPSSSVAGLEGNKYAYQGLMAEPADILIDAPTGLNAMAYVSCTGGDSVVQVDLTSGQIVRLFHSSLSSPGIFQIKSPCFLSFEPLAVGETGYRKVLVAPLVSGNNTIWEDGLNQGTSVRDLFAAPFQSGETTNRLPDVDLFRITPAQTTLPQGAVEVAARRTGTLLFAHGVNPVTGGFWQLNSDAHNGGAGDQSEPAVKGRFYVDRINFVPRPFAPTSSNGTVPAGQRVLRYLNPVALLNENGITGNPPAVSASDITGQPFALTFNQQYGQAFVTGLLTDNVMMLSSAGARMLEWNISMPAGQRAIPRGILAQTPISATSGRVLVYCWGDNKVRDYLYNSVAQTATLQRTLSLAADLSPQVWREGRAAFFDGSKSKYGNLSCASCHVEAGSDMLVWNLSNRPLSTAPGGYLPIDDKGGMVTQTLVGLQRLRPFHWRGERDFGDFRNAFTGLLGMTTPLDDPSGMPQATFDKLQAYVFSLANPANPYQHRDRVVADDIAPPLPLGTHLPPSLAVKGQTTFLTAATFKGGFRCVDCHSAQTGTVNDINREVGINETVRRNRLKPAAFHELWRKQQPVLNLLDGTTQKRRALLGSGVTHTGGFENLFAFVASIVTTDDQDRVNLASFVTQFDQGIAPSVHAALLLDQSHYAAAADELTSYLLPHALGRNCDLTASGKISVSGTPTLVRWNYNRSTGMFQSDRTGVADRLPAAFLTPAQSGTETTTFVATPVGSGERLSIDWDMDGKRNFAGDANPTVPNVDLSDTSAPQFTTSGQPAVSWVTAKVARVHFETTEPTTARVFYRLMYTGVSYLWVDSLQLAKSHSVILDGLRPSTTIGTGYGVPAADMWYEIYVQIDDASPNSPSTSSPTYNFKTRPFIAPFDGATPNFDPQSEALHRRILRETRVSSLDMIADIIAGKANATVGIVVNLKRGEGLFGGPITAQNVVVIGHVLVHLNGGTTIRVDVEPPGSGDSHLVVSNVRLETIAGDQLDIDGNRLNVDGPFVTNATPFPNGTGFLYFKLSDQNYTAAVGDKVEFVVDAVLEANSAAPLTPTAGVLVVPVRYTDLPIVPGAENGQRAFAQWSFPDSKEIGGSWIDDL